MFGLLPDFTPRDPHSLWYSSSRSGINSHPQRSESHSDPHQQRRHQREQDDTLAATTLARLASDEMHFYRRRMNVQNFGSGWLKPPGVPKTLYQMREEKREQEEHVEAMRREALAHELEQAGMEGMEGVEGEGGMDDVQLDGAQDLDDEIPDAEGGLGYGVDDEPDDDDDDDEEEEGGNNEEEEGEEVNGHDDALRRNREQDLIADRMHMTEDAFREALARGDPNGDDMYNGEEVLSEEEEAQIFDEDDFVNIEPPGSEDDMGDMDADLDNDIPEAESGGYEHTDSEEELSSEHDHGVSDEEDGEQEQNDGDDDDDDDDGSNGVEDIGFAPRAAPLGPPQSPTTRMSMDLSNLLSQDESSFMDDSPVPGRRAR